MLVDWGVFLLVLLTVNEPAMSRTGGGPAIPLMQRVASSPLSVVGQGDSWLRRNLAKAKAGQDESLSVGLKFGRVEHRLYPACSPLGSGLQAQPHRRHAGAEHPSPTSPTSAGPAPRCARAYPRHAALFSLYQLDAKSPEYIQSSCPAFSSSPP